MRELLLIIALMFLGAMVGANCGGWTIRNVGFTDEFAVTAVAMSASLGGACSTIAAYFIIACWRRSRKPQRAEGPWMETPRSQDMRPFRERLAEYLHVEAKEIADDNAPPRPSSSLRRVLDGLYLVPPKSAERIRQTLHRIRRSLRK